MTHPNPGHIRNHNKGKTLFFKAKFHFRILEQFRKLSPGLSDFEAKV